MVPKGFAIRFLIMALFWIAMRDEPTRVPRPGCFFFGFWWRIIHSVYHSATTASFLDRRNVPNA